MPPLHDNDRFWTGHECFIAVNPHRPQDADGLASFASSAEETRSLLFFQTSGSEGVPKWVGLSRGAFLASARAVNAHLEAVAQDRWLIALPLHHVGGFAVLARSHESDTSFFHMQEKWEAGRFAECCHMEGITLASLVPAQVFDIVQAGLEAPSSLRAVVVGGGALAKDTGLRARSLGWPVLQSYGMTEACSQIATEPLDHLCSGFDPDALEVLPGWELSTDEDGTLTMRGAALASGYSVKQDGSWRWEPIPSAGGLLTRDRVQLLSRGTRRFLRFIGRESAFVKVLGELVNVADVQARLERLAGSMGLAPEAVAVVPVGDARRETRLILVGELPDDTIKTLRLRFNEAVAGHERLDEARSIARLPRSGLGKLDARAVQELLGAQQAGTARQ